MKNSILLIIPGACLAACANAGTSVVYGPVGPQPAVHRDAVSTGYLKVFSAPEDHNDGDTHYYTHSSYTVCGEDGHIVKRVANATSIHDETPSMVELPTGRYIVMADADGYGMVKVSVIVESGQLTVLNLEQTPLRRTTAENSDHMVKLPNGRSIGWRAD